MTEHEWLTTADPLAMIEALSSPGDPVTDWMNRPVLDRKYRLFAVACVHRFGPHVGADASRLPKIEALIDRGASASEYRALDPLLARMGIDWARHQCHRLAEHGAALAGMLRDFVGNPFRPVTLPTLTPLVRDLARLAYEERPGKKCEKCYGEGGWKRCNGCGGEWAGKVGPDCFVCGHPYLTDKQCPECQGTGRIADGQLDPLTLAALADALEEAGVPGWVDIEVVCEACKGTGNVSLPGGFIGCYRCARHPSERGTGKRKCQQEHPILASLRSAGQKYRGLWALDMVLGKE